MRPFCLDPIVARIQIFGMWCLAQKNQDVSIVAMGGDTCGMMPRHVLDGTVSFAWP